MENKKIQVSISTILLIISLIIIIIMGYIIYTLSTSKSETDQEINDLRAETQNTQTALNTIQTYLTTNVNDYNSTTESTSNQNTSIISDNTIAQNTSTNTPKTEQEQVEEIAQAFVEAVNDKDWDSVEKYSSDSVVNELKKYNVSNMSIDLSTLTQNPNTANAYYCHDSYDIDHNGLEAADLGLGKIFCIENINGEFVVTTFYATGL